MSGANEDLWADATDPAVMVERLRKGLGPRGRRPLAFFAIHLARLALPAMPDARSPRALDVAELHLLGLATAGELADAASAADVARQEARHAYAQYAHGPATQADHAGRAVRMSDSLGAHAAYHAAAVGFYDGLVGHTRDALGFRALVLGAGPRLALTDDACRILRELAADPLRPPPFQPAWRTETAVLLARQMLAANDFSAMPILADALQDAGCDGDDVLNHCRDPGRVHLRGCWVLEAVLGS